MQSQMGLPTVAMLVGHDTAHVYLLLSLNFQMGLFHERMSHVFECSASIECSIRLG